MILRLISLCARLFVIYDFKNHFGLGLLVSFILVVFLSVFCLVCSHYFFAKFPITWRYIIAEVFHLCCIFPEKFLGSQVARLK